jgi:hypothetical protein
MSDQKPDDILKRLKDELSEKIGDRRVFDDADLDEAKLRYRIEASKLLNLPPDNINIQEPDKDNEKA